ncbi:MAG: hypothetical protein IJT60_00610 [Clostridia bacterium]|nr:hypothetical protein [Clostridia bacterium]
MKHKTHRDNECYRPPEFQRFSEFKYFPPEQFKPKEQTFTDVPEFKQGIPESSNDPQVVRMGPKAKDLKDINEKKKKQNIDKSAGDKTGSRLKGVSKIKMITHKVAESAATMAGSVAATVAAAVVAVTILTNYAEPAPNIDSFRLSAGQDYVMYESALSQLNEGQHYEWQVLQNGEIIASFPAGEGFGEGSFDNLLPNTEYTLRLVGDNGAVGGFIEYYTEVFRTLEADRPEGSFWVNAYETEDGEQISIFFEAEYRDLSKQAKDFIVTVYNGDEQIYVSEPSNPESEPWQDENPEEEPWQNENFGFLSGDFLISKDVETLRFVLSCTWSGKSIQISDETYRIADLLEGDEPVDDYRLAEDWVSQFGTYLIFEGRVEPPAGELAIELTLYGSFGDTTETLYVEPDADGNYSASYQFNYGDSAYSYSIKRIDTGTYLRTAEGSDVIEERYDTFGATFDPVSPDDAEVSEDGDTFTVSLHTGFETDPNAPFGYRVTWLDEEGRELVSWEGTDDAPYAELTADQYESWTALRYASLGYFREEHVYEEVILVRSELPSPQFGVTSDETLQELVFNVEPQFDMADYGSLFFFEVTLYSGDTALEPLVFGLNQNAGTQAPVLDEFSFPIQLDQTMTAFSYRIYEFEETIQEETAVYVTHSKTPLQYDRSVYGASLNGIDPDAFHNSYLDEPNGSFYWASGFDGDPDVFGFKLELIDSFDGTVVFSYEGSDMSVLIEPTGDFDTVRLTKYGFFTEMYVYDSEEFEVTDPTGHLSVEETYQTLSLTGSSDARFPLHLRVSVKGSGNTDPVYEKDFEPSEAGALSFSTDLEYDDTAYSYTLSYVDGHNQTIILEQQENVPLSLSRSFGATYVKADPSQAVVSVISDTETQISIQTNFQTPDPDVFTYRVEWLDSDFQLLASYEGTDSVASAQLADANAWTYLKYVSVGHFKTDHVYEETVLRVGEDKADVTVSESMTELEFVVSTDQVRSQDITDLKLEVILYEDQFEGSPVYYELQKNTAETIFQIPIDPTITAYSYRVLGKDGNDQTLAFASAPKTDLELVRGVYGASLNELYADELYVSYLSNNKNSLTWQSGFEGDADVFAFRLELFDGDGDVVASYEGSGTSVSLNPTADFVSAKLTKIGYFTDTYIYDEETSDVFAPEISLVPTESLAQLSFALTSNLTSAPYGCYLDLFVTVHGSQDLEFTTTFEKSGSDTNSFAIDLAYTDQSYEYSLVLRDAWGNTKTVQSGGVTVLTVSRLYGANYSKVLPDGATIESKNDGYHIKLNTGFTTQDPVFVYQIDALNATGQVIGTYRGASGQVDIVVEDIDDWAALTYTSIGLFREEYTYESQSYQVGEESVNLSVSELIDRLTFDVSSHSIRNPDVEELTLILTLYAGADNLPDQEIPILLSGSNDNAYVLLDPTYTSYSYRVVASGDTGGKVYAQQSQISFQIDRTVYQATVNVPDANEIYAAYKLSSNGSLTWNSGFSSQYDVFGYRLELFASTGGRVGVYEGRAAQAVITPTADFTTVRLTKYGTFVSEYVYDTENYQVFKPTGSVNASETPTQLEFQIGTNLETVPSGAELKLRVTLHGDSDTVFEKLYTSDTMGDAYTVALNYDETTYSYVLTYTDVYGLSTVLSTGTNVELEMIEGREFDGAFEASYPELGSSTYSNGVFTIPISPWFSSDHPDLFAVRIEFFDANDHLLGSYEGTDEETTIQITDYDALSKVVYSGIGYFRDTHVFEDTVQEIEIESETAGVEIDESFDTLNVHVYGDSIMNPAVETLTLHIDLTGPAGIVSSYNEVMDIGDLIDGGLEFSYDLNQAITGYAYTITANTNKVYAQDSDQLSIDRTVYGATLNTPDPDELHADYRMTQMSHLSWDSGFDGDFDRYGYRFILMYEAKEVYTFDSPEQVVDIETGNLPNRIDFDAIVIQKYGKFGNETYTYSSDTYSVFKGTATVSVTEHIDSLDMTISTNMATAPFEPVVYAYLYMYDKDGESHYQENQLEEDEWQEILWNVSLQYKDVEYELEIRYSDPWENETTIYYSGRVPLEISHEFDGTLNMVSADEIMQAYGEADGDPFVVTTGFSSTSSVFFYQVDFMLGEEQVVFTYSGRDPSFTAQPDNEFDAVKYTIYADFEEPYPVSETVTRAWGGVATVDSVTEDETSLTFTGHLEQPATHMVTAQIRVVWEYEEEMEPFEDTVEIQTDANDDFEVAIGIPDTAIGYSWYMEIIDESSYTIWSSETNSMQYDHG